MHGGLHCTTTCAVVGGVFPVVRETASACVCRCACQTKALVLSIQSERPRWCFPPSANKRPRSPRLPRPSLISFHPPIVCLTPSAVPAEKTTGFPPPKSPLASPSVYAFMVQRVHLSSERVFSSFCHISALQGCKILFAHGFEHTPGVCTNRVFRQTIILALRKARRCAALPSYARNQPVGYIHSGVGQVHAVCTMKYSQERTHCGLL